MKTFVDWISHHVLTTLLIAGSVYSVCYVIYRRKQLFYRE
jgi:hypothetical protein